MSKSVSTGTNTRVSRLLNKKAKSKDANYLNAQETFGFPSTTFKSESILNTPDKKQAIENKRSGSNESTTPIKVIYIIFAAKHFNCFYNQNDKNKFCL